MNIDMKMDTTGRYELYRHDATVCHGCKRNQRRVKSYRNAVIYSLITCGLFVIVSLIANAVIVSQLTEFTNRLNDLDRENNALKSRLTELERNVQGTAQQPSSSDLDDVNSDVVTSQFDVLSEVGLHERQKRRTNQKTRRGKKKKCKNCLPAVQIEGNGGFSKEDKTELSGYWKTSTWVKPNTKAKFFETKQVNDNGKLKVVKDGLYLLYAQMTLSGKSKRGYYVKKEPHKTSIASCINYSEGDDKSDAKSCPTLTIVKLVKGDSIYVEEIETNSSVLYSGVSAVLGLVRVGD